LESLELNGREYFWDMDVWGWGWGIILKEIFRENVADWVDPALMGSCEHDSENWC
jgi:hypothetical protein